MCFSNALSITYVWQYPLAPSLPTIGKKSFCVVHSLFPTSPQIDECKAYLNHAMLGNWCFNCLSLPFHCEVFFVVFWVGFCLRILNKIFGPLSSCLSRIAWTEILEHIYSFFWNGWSLTRPMYTLSNVQMNMTSHLKNTYFASENHSCAIGWMLNVVAVEDFLPKDVKWNNFKLFVWVNCISKSLTLFANFQTKFSHNVNKRCWNMVRGKETKTDMKSLVTKRERLTVYYFCKELNFVCFHLFHANEW